MEIRKPAKLSLSKIRSIVIIDGIEISSPTPDSYTAKADKMNAEIKKMAISDAQAEQEAAHFICVKG